MATLSIGADDWPVPIPLKHAAQGWSFDVVAGREEILDRRIGANELYTQQVDAMRRTSIFRACMTTARCTSMRKQDGLYWPTEEGEPQSPLGALIAEARTAGYHPGENIEPQPFHGYYFHILAGQGPHAPGVAFDYVANGLMLGGFGLVAWPAHWGNTGVMTFIVNQDGEIFERISAGDSGDGKGNDPV